MVVRTTNDGLTFPSIRSRYAVRMGDQAWQHGIIRGLYPKPAQSQAQLQSQAQAAQSTAAPLLPHVDYRYYLVHIIAVAAIVAAIAVKVLALQSSAPPPSPLTALRPAGASVQQTAGSPAAAAAHVAKPTDRLAVPALGINAPVIKQGTASDGTIATPNNLWQVSLYTGEQAPGQAGNVIIVGHSGAPGQVGVFRNLPKVAVGSDITYTTAAGVQYVYQVTGKQSYNATDPAAKADIYTPTSKPMLHLITCDGTWINSAYAYTQRMIVDAVLVKS